MNRDVIIVIPTYNERGNIARLVEYVFAVVPEVGILVVDDSSPDGTAEVVRGLQTQFPAVSLLVRARKEGLGRAYLHAFHNIIAAGEVKKIIMMDADFSHDVRYLPEMIAESKNNDVVIGSRYIPGGRLEGWEWWRRLLSSWGNRYSRTITRIPLTDCTGGFNLIDVSLLRQLDLDRIGSSGYAFQIELKYRLWKSSARFKEIPIIFRNRINGESKISSHIIKEGIIAPWKMILKK